MPRAGRRRRSGPSGTTPWRRRPGSRPRPPAGHPGGRRPGRRRAGRTPRRTRRSPPARPPAPSCGPLSQPTHRPQGASSTVRQARPLRDIPVAAATAPEGLWTVAHACGTAQVGSNACLAGPARSRVAAGHSWRRAIAQPTTGSPRKGSRCGRYSRSPERRGPTVPEGLAASTSYPKSGPENGRPASPLVQQAVGVLAMRLNGTKSARSGRCAAEGQVVTSLVARIGTAAVDTAQLTISNSGR